MRQKAIRKELALLRKKLIAAGESENNALNLARKAMNEKYGHQWRDQVSSGWTRCGPI